MDFVEICNVYIGKMIIKAAKRIFNSDKICCSYNDLNYGVTFFGTQCIFQKTHCLHIMASYDFQQHKNAAVTSVSTRTLA